MIIARKGGRKEVFARGCPIFWFSMERRTKPPYLSARWPHPTRGKTEEEGGLPAVSINSFKTMNGGKKKSQNVGTASSSLSA